MKLLLDTHAFLWWANDPDKLSQKALEHCSDSANNLILSVVSVWEMQIKIQLGKLKLSTPISELIGSQQKTNNLEVLPVELVHVLALSNLPVHHKDPFDRLLVVQAQTEDAYLVSSDSAFVGYPVRVIW